MMKRFVLALWCSLLLAAPPTIRLSPTRQLSEHDFLPMAVPTSLEDVFSQDVYLTFIRLTNTTAGSLTVTVADKQGSPIAILAAVSIAANTTYIIKLDPHWCANGVTWIASGAGVTGYMRGLK